MNPTHLLKREMVKNLVDALKLNQLEPCQQCKGYLAPEKKRVSSNGCKSGQEFKKYNPHVDLVSGW
jgi:hypothetical protein